MIRRTTTGEQGDSILKEMVPIGAGVRSVGGRGEGKKHNIHWLMDVQKRTKTVKKGHRTSGQLEAAEIALGGPRINVPWSGRRPHN